MAGRIGAIIVCALAAQPLSVRADDPTFEKDVVPILHARCFKCHGGEQKKAGLDLRRRFLIVAGGDSGTALTPGKPEESLLIEVLREGTMPPKEEGPFDAKQLDLLTRWVAAGAKTQSDKEAPLDVADSESGISDADRRHWAFQTPVRPAVPTVKDAARVRTPIDAFLLTALEAKGLSFAPEADRATLLRRAVFDLHGLPPTPEQLDEFLADADPQAYEKLIDRLLDSPRYGERWGRHWLDVAGYADSDGYLEADRDRPEAWRYRDYVIRAINADVPYDQFLREQIAGDELSDWRRADELTPEMQDQLIATGFLRCASDPTYPGYKEKLECYKVMADTTHIVSSALLGVTLQCARCHAHKSDPFTQGDYYRLHAVFLPSYDPDRWLASSERFVPLATLAQEEKIKTHNARLDQRLAGLNQELTDGRQTYVNKLLKEQLAKVPADKLEAVKAAVLIEAAKRNEEQKKLVAEFAPDVAVTDEALFKQFPEWKTESDLLKAAVAAETALRKSFVQARGLMDLYPEATQGRVLRRGDFNNLGANVDPGVPEVLAEAAYKLQPEAGHQTTGRRKAFADWLVSEKHPLTARVHVNRVWAHHFGRGIVSTVDDFGRMGAAPSHPELLDWLAVEFRTTGWSQKALHKLLLTSTAYRQTADRTPHHTEADPDNVLLGSFPPQRHEGEVVRDALLALAGQLNLDMFGPPVPVSRQADGTVVTPDNAPGKRRSVYVVVKRSQPLTLLELFDTPRMEINCTRRTEAIVAPQALTLLNSRFTEASAKALADRLLAIGGTDDASRLQAATRFIYTRDPLPAEQTSVAAFLDAFEKSRLGDKWETTPLADRQPHRNAGWSHVCEALLNSNEFLYVH